MTKSLPHTLRRAINTRAHALATVSYSLIRSALEQKAVLLRKERKPLTEIVQVIQAATFWGDRPRP